MLSFLRQTSPRFMKKKTRDYDLAAWGYTLVMDTGDSWVYTPMEPGHPTIIIEVVLGGVVCLPCTGPGTRPRPSDRQQVVEAILEKSLRVDFL